MTIDRNLRAGLLIVSLFAGFLWLFKDILLPFIMGLLIAYLLNPVVARLTARGWSRSVAAGVIFLLFVLLLVAAIAVLVPLLQFQFVELGVFLPEYINKFSNAVTSVLRKISMYLPDQDAPDLKKIANGYADEAFSWTGQLVKGLWKGGLAVFDILSLLVVTPVVAFYLLRDWPQVCRKVDDLLPRQYAETIHGLLREIDSVISAFLRGQALVCLVLGVGYAIALFLLDVKLGLLIGLGSGILSFIPYVGSITGFVTATSVAWFQSGSITLPLLVAAVFMLGQFIEGNFLTPRLVGEKVGLPAVWVLFALLAGGNLLGFTGVILAVPVAAIIGVLTRFALRQYQQSAFFREAEKPRKPRSSK